MRAAPQSRLLIALLAGLCLAAALFRFGPAFRRISNPTGRAPGLAELPEAVARIEAAEEQAAKRFWAKELLAQDCARVIEQLWDNVRDATNKLAVVAAFPCGEMVRPVLSSAKALPLGLQLFQQTGTGQILTRPDWQQFLIETARAGWELTGAEFRHVRFETDTRGRPDRSRFYFSAQLVNPPRADRAILEGNLEVFWGPPARAGQPAAVRRIETSGLSVRERQGAPAFREVLLKPVAPMEGSYFIDPLILYDLDNDGRSEVILAARNLVLHRDESGRFLERPLCAESPGLIFTGMIADFDGDGAPDFLCAKFDGLWLFKGSAQGTFDTPGQLAWQPNPRLKYGQALTCGDIDGDGDLDVWLGQYKPPYDRGQMPTPYYDANDGYPSYLLINDGSGHFTDATASGGLVKKRWRRAYSGSFVDLNQDHHLDLVVANDFAGVDVYSNDGHGHFSDVTDAWIPERHAFGMSQICADFDGDGQLDLLITGMNVPVVDRLLQMDCSRPGFESWVRMGKEMVYGNRLYLGQSGAPFRHTTLNEPIARTGWSWGSSALDVDNDGFLDLYIANGHETRQSVRDYDNEFWLHDIYVGNSRDSLTAFAYFQAKFARTRGKGMSYGGNEKNRLFLNQHGTDFVEVAHLMGVGLEQDSRNVVADDLDGDGRLDLLVTTFEAWPKVQQTLRIYENQLQTDNHWIGFRLREQGRGISPVGARVELRYAGRTAVRQVVAGDSYRSQQPNTLHFGLGSAQQVDSAEVRWANGQTVTIRNPAVNHYHNVSPME